MKFRICRYTKTQPNTLFQQNWKIFITLTSLFLPFSGCIPTYHVQQARVEGLIPTSPLEITNKKSSRNFEFSIKGQLASSPNGRLRINDGSHTKLAPAYGDYGYTVESLYHTPGSYKEDLNENGKPYKGTNLNWSQPYITGELSAAVDLFNHFRYRTGITLGKVNGELYHSFHFGGGTGWQIMDRIGLRIDIGGIRSNLYQASTLAKSERTTSLIAETKKRIDVFKTQGEENHLTLHGSMTVNSLNNPLGFDMGLQVGMGTLKYINIDSSKTDENYFRTEHTTITPFIFKDMKGKTGRLSLGSHFIIFDKWDFGNKILTRPFLEFELFY